jgi:hypothetical protein
LKLIFYQYFIETNLSLLNFLHHIYYTENLFIKIDLSYQFTLCIFQGCYFMNLRTWAWVSEHEQGVGLNLFKNILLMLTIYLKNILSHLRHNIWWCGKIFYHMSWMNFFMNIHNKFCFAKNYTKETRHKKFMLVYCEQFITWNAQVILELVFQIPLLPSIFQLCSIQTI